MSPNPHAADTRHPDEVNRLMRLLPEIPTGGSRNQVVGMLGLKGEPTGGKYSGGTFIEIWDIAPGYRFVLATHEVVRGDGLDILFGEASVSARGKPGFPPDEYHTIYPVRLGSRLIRSPADMLRPDGGEGAGRP